MCRAKHGLCICIKPPYEVSDKHDNKTRTVNIKSYQPTLFSQIVQLTENFLKLIKEVLLQHHKDVICHCFCMMHDSSDSFGVKG